jgi:hypothetical protein
MGKGKKLIVTSLVLAIVLVISAIIALATFVGTAMGKKNLQVFMKSLKITTPLNLIIAIFDIVVVILFFLGI